MNQIVEMLKKQQKKFILFLLLLFFVCIFFTSQVFFKNDGTSQTGVYNIYYRGYSKKSGWSKWKKNGSVLMVSDYIENIEFYLKGKNDKLYVKKYNERGKWTSKATNNIYGIRIALYDELYRKYNVCYRTYNSKFGWMGWSCNNEINGVKNLKIKKISVKIIPKNVEKSDYLKDYLKDINPTNTGF